MENRHRSTSSLPKLGMSSKVNYDLIDSETVNKSFGYTGKGVATYPNGDTYDGFFVNGVSCLLKSLPLANN